MKEIFMALFIFACVGIGVWYGYQYYESRREAHDARPSIAVLTAENLPENIPLKQSNQSEDSSGNDVSSVNIPLSKPDNPESIALKVFNGGAAGGSAGKMVSFLKESGYGKAEAGNANGSNSGVVLYYSPEMSDEAKVLQLVLLKKYKGVVAKPSADAKIPEAKAAPIVVVLGI